MANEQNLKTPWLKSYGSIPFHLEYPDCSMVEMVEQCAEKYPDLIAYEFMGKKVPYKTLVQEIDLTARSFAALGIRPGDIVTVCMPNCPQGLHAFYALNKIGAIATMIHPLSAEGEIKYYLNDTGSKAIITLEQFYGKVSNIIKETRVRHVILSSIADGLPALKALLYPYTAGKNIPKVPKGADKVLWWKDLLKMGKAYTGKYVMPLGKDDPAVILYSGGTTGVSKGILLTSYNFNALARQTVTAGDCVKPGMSMLAIMPLFHGFGLGVSVHTILTHGCRCILVPQFNANSYAQLLKKQRPNLIAGVPTLYEALLRNPYLEGVDLSCLKAMFSGGDSLSVELKRKVDKFLREHNAPIQVREGYGTTESVTACCLTPKDAYREGSIGLPFPDTYMKIVKPDTEEEVPYGEEGEICIHGPTVMKGYLNHPEETAMALRKHPDGAVWYHTGDLGVQDADGFIYFKQRLKRMIVSSGYNIYPSQLENVIDGHPAVSMSTVIGVPDPYKMQKVKAFIVLREGQEPTEEVKNSILEHCRKNIAKYAMPYEFEYRKELPKTLVGKVAFTVLEKEEAEKIKNQQK